jgi:hypothetical protein
MRLDILTFSSVRSRTKFRTFPFSDVQFRERASAFAASRGRSVCGTSCGTTWR